MIDYNIRIGDVAVIASLVGSCLFYAFRSGRFAENILTMQKEITELKEVAKSLAVIITNQAVQTLRQDTQGERLNILDKRIEDLRHGQEIITKSAR